MKTRPIFGVFLIYSACLFAQEADEIDALAFRTGTVAVIADANYSAKNYLINFQPYGAVYDDSSVTNGATGINNAILQSVLLKSNPIYSILYNAIMSIANFDKQIANAYQFTIPVAGNYTIVCSLKGDIDFPRNRVIINSQYTTVLDWDGQLGSNQQKVFNVYLEPGPHVLAVGLGSGSSFDWHTPGQLDNIRLYQDIYATWTQTVILSGARYRMLDLLPQIGSRALVSVTWDGSLYFDNNITQGSVNITQIRPLNPVYYNSTYWSINKRWKFDVIIRDLRPFEYQPVLFTGTTATYFLERGTDLVRLKRAYVY
jgi:hypothetical protein